MNRVAMLACALLVGGCGYTLGALAHGPRRLAVGPVEEDGIDVDGAALVGRSVARAVASGPSIELADGESAEACIGIKLIETSVQLAPNNDPNARALQYRATIRILATLIQADGTKLWTSPVIRGEAPYISPPGALVALEGARRRALARAADDAAAQLVALMVHGRS